MEAPAEVEFFLEAVVNLNRHTQHFLILYLGILCSLLVQFAQF